MHMCCIASFPGLPCFLFFDFIQYNTRKRKSAKNRGGLGTRLYNTYARKPKNKKRGRPANAGNVVKFFTFTMAWKRFCYISEVSGLIHNHMIF